jgi:hypothetical protein
MGAVGVVQEIGAGLRGGERVHVGGVGERGVVVAEAEVAAGGERVEQRGERAGGAAPRLTTPMAAMVA